MKLNTQKDATGNYSPLKNHPTAETSTAKMNRNAVKTMEGTGAQWHIQELMANV